LNLTQLQEYVDSWIKEHGGYWDKYQILARLTEELGETASALQRVDGLRPTRQEVDLESEIGDLLFTLAAFANANSIELQSAFEGVMKKYTLRDSKEWKEKLGIE